MFAKMNGHSEWKTFCNEDCLYDNEAMLGLKQKDKKKNNKRQSKVKGHTDDDDDSE